MTSFNEINEVKFEFEDITTYDVQKNKFGGYSIPVVLDNETKAKIESIATEHNTKNPLYKSTLYLKAKCLSEKQNKELLNKGKQHIKVHFKITGTYTKDDVTYLVFKVTKLCKTERPESAQASDNECPED